MVCRIATYNVEHFDRLFEDGNSMKTGQKEQERFANIKFVMEKINADLIGIVEAPNTKTDGSKKTEECLNKFAEWAQLPIKSVMIGLISSGSQEMAVLYNPDKFSIVHKPGGISGDEDNPPFDEEFLFDTDDDRIKEYYQFYFPPLEAEVTVKSTGFKFRLMVVHPKSKGIFSSVDLLHWGRESRRNRRKLYAECAWIRKRVEEWLGDNQAIVVMGDFNDGPGMDYYEVNFGRSAFEMVMGDIFDPKAILINHAGRPKWTDYGWNPASASFKDAFTGSRVNVLIDHILISKNIPIEPGSYKIWNPDQHAELEPDNKKFTNASDHFPVTLDLA